MSASGSTLTPLLSTHDLKLVCAKCCVKEKEITYTLKSVRHQCECNLLLCRAKAGTKWRPVSERPAFPNPSKYEVCDFFVEGSGCTYHRNRCSFARSKEEAAVWNFEKKYQLDHVFLCQLVAQSEAGCDQRNSCKPLGSVMVTLQLKVACEFCCVREKETTYAVRSVHHMCRRKLLLVKTSASDKWRPVSKRPTQGHFGANVLYQKCDYFVEGFGCTKHGNSCNFARSHEEAAIWNYIRDQNINEDELFRQVIKSEAVYKTPESSAEGILQRFSGEFTELCKDCFLGQPQRLTGKRWNATCSGDAAHRWDPILVHHLSENNGKHIYSQVRPLPPNCRFDYCSYVLQGKPCWHQPGQCQSAQSLVELAVWKAENSGLSIRPLLLQLSQRDETESANIMMYCKVCLLVLPSPERFYQHCSSLDHARLLSADTTIEWTGRRPPHNRQADLWLCERPQSCEYGINCPKAHSEEELQEWIMRAAEEKEIRHNIEAQGLMSYNEKLLEEYRNSSADEDILSQQVDDVRISCDQNLTVKSEQIDATMQWNFRVETERELVHVALLKQEPGACFTIGHMCSTPCIYSKGEHFLREGTNYDITVSFKPINPGLYEQWLVLDFGMRPLLLRKLQVRIGQSSVDESEEQACDLGVTFQSVERWHQGNRMIMPCLTRTEEEDQLLKEYKPPQTGSLHAPAYNSKTPLTHENYKERMHNFLYNEEQANDQVVSRLNVCGEMTTQDILSSIQFGIKKPPVGQVFLAVSVPCSLTPDTPEGQVLKRSIQSALVAPLSSNDGFGKVYEAIILKGTTSENKMYLELSKNCCADLALKSNESYQMEVQFMMNRLSFCTMHKAIDILTDTKGVLPDLKNCGVPVNNIRCEKLNTKQKFALNFIAGNSTVPKSVAPLLIYGPFGTGKTFTLATAARELCRQPSNKVLICTHTNSSADLYVRDHLHPFINNQNDGLRPIRIKANKEGITMSSTDDITLKYCHRSADHQCFLQPTKAVLDRHNIIITTATMAINFQDLKLPEGYFTHILIDEASQMLECEALIALCLSGPNTKIVLAGDHMQMGPKLFSVDDHHRSDHTLLNRLFHYYQDQKCDAAQHSRIIFSENYRSTKEIVDFVSTHFYVGKNDVIKAVGNIPAPTNGSALKFHHVRGECLFETVSMTWYNKEEVAQVVEEVKEILTHWPLTWGTKNPSSICILSEGVQVRLIRSALYKTGLREVKVENIANVQGKQFRVIILTTVHTRDSLKMSHLPGLELFNDARVLNTAMTRAQSCVVVVGDAAALCCFGKCSGVWRRYIDHCISNDSVAPQHFTKGYFERDVMEIAKFQKTEREDDRHILDDAILQELTDEYERLETQYIVDEEDAELGHPSQHKSGSYPSYDRSDIDKEFPELCKSQPDMYMQGKLIREYYNRGYVIPSQNPSRIIHITGQANLGQAFTGDEVILQTASTPKVLRVVNEEKSSRILECLLDDEDHSKKEYSESDYVKRTMTPITKSAPKIRILLLKRRRNFLPIRKQIDGHWTVVQEVHLNENLKQNSVFVVEVISWREQYYYPLGYVTEIIQVGRSLDDGLRILNKEFKLAPSTCKSHERFSLEDKNGVNRNDICDVKTFTVDPKGAEDLDDAISVREIGDKYELGIHIADVASFVGRGSKLDNDAEQCGITYYGSGNKNIHMFPEELCKRHFSLLLNKVRRVVSLMIMVNKQTHKIEGKANFQLSTIKSNRQFSYEEAEQIISQRYGNEPKFDTIEDCVTVAYCFAKAHRKERLLDWAYSQIDDDRLPGKRKAHLMIEELSVLFNTRASAYLIDSVKTRFCTPLRCQAKPNPEKVEEFKESTSAELIPLSFKVRHRVDPIGRAPNCNSFHILTEVWNDIQSAATTGDIDKMVDLIAADDIHPLLQPITHEFRRCLSKAYIIRSNSCPKADVGHYSLSVASYTQASSPIRRYMDVILQRLLHSVICNKNVQYSPREISALCHKFDSDIRKAKDYEQKSEQISYAVSTKQQSAPKLSFVINTAPNKDNFAVAFPFNKNIFADSLPIMYKHLQLWDQPLYDEKNNSVTLTWKRRIYSVDAKQMSRAFRNPVCAPCVEIPLERWRAVINAIEDKNWNLAKSLILSFKASPKDKLDNQQQSSKKTPLGKPEAQLRHEVDINIKLRPGDTLHVQMTSEINRGYRMPAFQLVCIQPNFEICVDHVHSPITCFSRSAEYPARIHYSDTKEYIRIWRPICEMESVNTAVNEGDGIIIENMVVKFQQKEKRSLTGSFFLPLTWINEWEIEFNLSKCLLCIRKRGLKVTKAPNHAALVDPGEFTWVAHGITTAEDKKEEHPKGSNVEFSIHHLPMEKIPDCVFQKNTPFTVEIIPKNLPNVRMETAVISIASACDLVKAIALGTRLPREVQTEWNMTRINLPVGLPELNLSQRQAVNRALNSSFTLVWGPPGTGKTIVGVHIVYCFLILNSKKPWEFKEPKDIDKKEVILYCGPSNKSVDVVAEYLLKFGSSLRPLRVYSQQVEMLDYPYPECTLQFSRRAFRQERAKSELKSITLHHRMRQDTNPCSAEIKKFDKRIQDVLGKKQKLLSINQALMEKEKVNPTPAVLEEINELQSRKLALDKIKDLTDQDVKEYKELLVKARIHEFKQHDIILCTCTQSSSPSLTKTVAARQIIIDECGMATEPQALVPLVSNNPEKIVLIGDPKQLRPIVTNVRAKKLGMAKSLFERYFETHRQRVVMLNRQYRMHEDICKFPSNEFYEEKLETAVQQPTSILRVEDRPMPIVFGHIEGVAISLIVNTAKGNENSKANVEERDKVIDIAAKLVSAKIEQQDIIILSPYNAQVSEIKDALKKKKMAKINVTTISKSQGSEWRYVIISTVCSVPSDQIKSEPDGPWIGKNLGFVGDANQINVAITRAKEGLCIIGNQMLLRCNKTWRHLLDHYSSIRALTDAESISVHGAR